MRNLKRLLSVLYCGIMLATVHPLYAQTQPGETNFALHAISQDGLSVVPYFVMDGAAGAQITGQIYIVNNGNSSGSVQLYPVDAATGNTGGTVLKMREDALTEVGGWIQLERETVTLAAGEDTLVPFVVSVPAGVRVGPHVGGLVMEPVQQQDVIQNEGQDEVSFQVDVKTRTAVAVQVNVPGATAAQLDVLGVQFGGHNSRQIIYLNLRNSGTELVKTTGSLLIYNNDGERLQTIRFHIDTFLPEDEIDYPVHVVAEALPAGSYTADLALRYGETAQTYQNQFSFDVSQADNVQIFSESGALASPLTSESFGTVNGRFFLQIVVMIALAILTIGFVVYFFISLYRYKQERRQMSHVSLASRKLAPLQKAPLPVKQPVRARGN